MKALVAPSTPASHAGNATWSWVDPTTDREWDDAVFTHPAANVFHTGAWARVLRDAYGYQLFYAMRAGGAGLLPIAEVASPFTGRRGVSLPFTDVSGPLDGAFAGDALEPLLELGRRRAWRYLELRGAGEPFPPFAPSARFVEHRLAIRADEEEQWRALVGAHRRNLAKARRSEVSVERSSDVRALDAYYALHCATRRRQGVPPQPKRFFRAIHRHLIAEGHGFVVLARHGSTPVAGAVFLHAGDEAIYKYSASDPRAWSTAPNNLVIWEAISHYRRQGVRTLSFGRTDVDASGLVRFKRGWGAVERPVVYVRATLRGDAPAEASALGPRAGAAAGAARGLMRRLPTPILQFLGRLTYRHVG
jgi:hypothetical protein